MIEIVDALSDLHRSLDARMRPEDVAYIISRGLRNRFTPAQLDTLEAAAQYSYLGRPATRWSSMSADFHRPIDASRQVATLGRLFDVELCYSAGMPSDPALLRTIAADRGEEIQWTPGQDNFKRDRLAKGERAAAGIELPKRQYNRRWRFLVRFARKIERLDTELRKRELMLIGRSGLAADITLERFQKDPDAAAFVAYFVARRNLRRQFSLAGKTNPFDAIAEMLFERCCANEDLGNGTDWWMITRVYSRPSVVAMLSDEDRGALLGRWSALMGGAAEILQRAWSPDINRTTMIVQRGMDSSTWNTIAQAYNTARAGWLNALAAAGALDLLDVACPGKVMRLMAADLAWWHQSKGGDVDPDTAVWASLPLPWDVLDGTARCTRTDVMQSCDRFGVDPEARGWTAPRAHGSVAAFEPTPELVHGVSVADPAWAALLRSAGAFSGKRIKAGYENVPVPPDVIVSDLPSRPMV